MSSRGKKKTTMAKLTRESRLRERRAEKEVKKQARRDAAAVEASHPGTTEPIEDPWVGSEPVGTEPVGTEPGA